MALQGSFSIAKINPTSILQIDTIRDEQFQAWTRFLNEHSIIRYALVTPVQLSYDALRELYCTAVNTSDLDGSAITYRFFGRSIRVTERDVNRILHFPMEDLVADPTPDQIEKFFQLIRYQDDFNTGTLSRTCLTQYWNFFFHILNHVFSSFITNQDRIPEFIQKIGYAVANNLRINFGKIVLGLIISKMKHVGTRDVQTQYVRCVYPRFLQLILNDFLSDGDRERLAIGRGEECSYMRTNIINYISNKNYADVPTVLTEYLKTVPLPLIPRPIRAGLRQCNIPIPAIPTSVSQERQFLQLIPQIQMPEQQTPTPQLSLKRPFIHTIEGDSASAAPHKEFVTSATLPLSKRSKPNEPKTFGLVPFNHFPFSLPERKTLDLFPDSLLSASGGQLTSREDESSRPFNAPSDKGPRMISFADAHLGGHAPVTKNEHNRLLARVQMLEKELSNTQKAIAEIKNLQLIQSNAFQAQLSSMAAKFSHAINSLMKTASFNLPTPHSTILEDNPTEGEKVDEQEAARRRKGKEKVVDTDLNLFWEKKS